MPRRSPLTQRDARAFDRDIGAGAHRDSDRGFRERGRVVDAVAGHGDDAPARLQLPERLRACRRAGPRRGPRRGPGAATASAVVRLSPVTITMRRPSCVQSGDGFRCRGLDRIGDADQRRSARRRWRGYITVWPSRRSASARSAIADDRRSRRPASSRGCRRRHATPARRSPGCLCPRSHGSPRREAASIGALVPPRRIAPASGCSLDCSSAAASASASSSDAPAATTIEQRRLAFGQRAGLVDDERVDRSSRSSASAFLTSTPAVAPRPVPTMMAIGVARPRRAGTGDDQHGHGADSASARRGGGPQRLHPTKASTATSTRPERSTPRPGPPAAESARGCAALRHHPTICASSVSAADPIGANEQRAGRVDRAARHARSRFLLRPASARRSPSTRRPRCGLRATMPSTGPFRPAGRGRRSPTCTRRAAHRALHRRGPARRFRREAEQLPDRGAGPAAAELEHLAEQHEDRDHDGRVEVGLHRRRASGTPRESRQARRYRRRCRGRPRRRRAR